MGIQYVIAIILYFVVLVAISRFRSRNATREDYLIGSKQSTWWLVTIGMISDSLSGLTYISVPGAVSNQDYAYLEIVFGYVFGYLGVAYILIPLYYKLNVISIYSYLGRRFGPVSETTGATFFILSRLFGAAARLFIAVTVLHQFFFPSGEVSAVWSFFAVMALILFYTYKGGIKSLVWTDAYQSVFLLLGIFSVFAALYYLDPQAVTTITSRPIFKWDFNAANYFWKSLIGGALITFAQNGLDQNVMQKNLSCKTMEESKKNFVTFTWIALGVNFFFVFLGALAAQYLTSRGIALPVPDKLLPTVVLEHLGGPVSILFILGLTAATFSSSDSVLPSIATAVEADLFHGKMPRFLSLRKVHFASAVVILAIIMVFHAAQEPSMIDLILRYLGYTYGPLLGLYTIGIATKWKLREKLVPYCALAACAFAGILHYNSAEWFNGYRIGLEMILITATLFIALAALTRQKGKV